MENVLLNGLVAVLFTTPAKIIFALLLVPLLAGMVFIRERQVGIIVKRFARRSLPPGRLLALAGEAGLQADTLAPGLHVGFWIWQFKIIKVPTVIVPQGHLRDDGSVMTFPSRIISGCGPRLNQTYLCELIPREFHAFGSIGAPTAASRKDCSNHWPTIR